MYGYDVQLVDESTRRRTDRAEPEGRRRHRGPDCHRAACRPCGATTRRFVETYWNSIAGRSVYNTFDWGIRDADGYFFILGRTDDVINVAGHRLGTREIEESISSHPNVAEVAVVGIADATEGPGGDGLRDRQGRVGARRRSGPAEARRRHHEDGRRPARRGGPPGAGALRRRLPKTRSGKLLRRAIQAICERRDPGDLTTIEDPSALQQIRELVEPAA